MIRQENTTQACAVLKRRSQGCACQTSSPNTWRTHL